LPASQQALKGVALSMKSQMAPRTATLSSTTRIHGVQSGGMVGKTNYRTFLASRQGNLFRTGLLTLRPAIPLALATFHRSRRSALPGFP
jgi:hypothetical protein